MKHDTQFDEKIIELFKQGIRAPKISVVVGCGVNIEVNGGGWHNTTTKITQDKKSLIIFLKIEDKRQQWKVEHILKDIVVIVLLGTLCDADSWTEMELWAEANERLLRRGKDKSNNGDKREDDRGSGNRNVNALHVVSAWSREVGICFGGEKESADYECGVI